MEITHDPATTALLHALIEVLGDKGYLSYDELEELKATYQTALNEAKARQEKRGELEKEILTGLREVYRF